MTYNLLISYDLNKELDSSGYQRLFEAISSLGIAARIQKSVWFVASQYNAELARDHLTKFMDSNDYLFVMEGSYAAWTRLEPGSGDVIKKHWTPKSR